MLLHTHGKAEKYIKNNTLKLNDYLKKNASPHAMKGAVKASLWQDNWQKQKAKTNTDTPRDKQKSIPKNEKTVKKDAPERSERPDNREAKKATKKTKKETDKTDSKDTQSNTPKAKAKEGETESKNTMVSKKSTEASDLIQVIQNLEGTTKGADDTNIFVNKEIKTDATDNTLDESTFFETDPTTDGDKEDNSDEPTWDILQQQAAQETVKDTDKSGTKQSVDPALLNQTKTTTQKMQKIAQGEGDPSKGKLETVTIEQMATDDPSKQKKTTEGVKVSDTTNKDGTQKGDVLKASKVENPEKIAEKDITKSTKLDKSMDNTKTLDSKMDTSKDMLDPKQVADTLKAARAVQQKAINNPESVDMSDLEKLASELRKLEEKTFTEKRLEKAALEAAGIRRSLENKMLEKQAVLTMMMERNALENSQRARDFVKATTPTQNDTTSQSNTTPLNPMVAPLATPVTRGSTSLSSGGLEMSNFASGSGTGGDSGGNNGQGQNKGDQQQGSYTAPKSEGRIMLDLTQQRNWQKTLAVRALQIAQGKGEARMQLHPAEMGALIVRVQVRDGATRINVVAEKEEATKILNENRHLLEQSFKEQGMDFQEFNLSQGNAQDFDGNGEKDDDDKPSFAQNLKDKAEENENTDSEKTVIKSDRLVDTMV